MNLQDLARETLLKLRRANDDDLLCDEAGVAYSIGGDGVRGYLPVGVVRSLARVVARETTMPGDISRSNPGPSDDAPYVPSWCYPNNKPKMCPCGHHEGYHGDDGACLHARRCGCKGLPTDCRTTDEAFYA